MPCKDVFELHSLYSQQSQTISDYICYRVNLTSVNWKSSWAQIFGPQINILPIGIHVIVILTLAARGPTFDVRI